MGRGTGGFRHVRGDGFQTIELRYVGTDVVMDVVLPDAGELTAAERCVAGGRLGSLVADLVPTSVALALPKLDFASSFALEPALRALGVDLLFDDGADLSGITRDEPLAVDDVVHQATLEVDESGTEAAAATATLTRAAGMPRPPEVEMKVDRPFILAVRDPRTGQVLFLARVLYPTGA
jgi:serpin B